MEKDRHGHGHLLNGNGMVEKLGTIGGSCRKIGLLVEIRQFELDEIPKGLEVWMASFPFRKVKPAMEPAFSSPTSRDPPDPSLDR